MARVSFLSSPPDLSRGQDEKGADRVTQVELFFDLVFVFAVTQLSQTLETDPTWTTALQTLILLLAMWWFWTYTTWTTNWLDPDRGVVRLMLFVFMFLGLLMSTSIPSAFEGFGGLFVLGYLGMQLYRCVFIVLAVRRRNPALAKTAVRNLIWFGMSSPLWIAGVVIGGPTQTVLWILALAVDYTAPGVRYRLPVLGAAPPESWSVAGRHVAERSGLFVIIALGESIVSTGSGLAEVGLSVSSLAAFAGALVGSILLWLVYFAHGAEHGSEFIEQSDQTGQVARRSYTYLHIPLIAGIVISAVGDALVLEDPDGEVTGPILLTVVGGALVYLVGNLLFKRSVGVPWLRGHIGGIVACVALIAASLLDLVLDWRIGDPLLLTWLVNLVLAVVAILGERRFRADEGDEAHGDELRGPEAAA